MALIKCTECGKEISDKAVACVNCGCPVSEMKIESPKTNANVSMNMFSDLFGGNAQQPKAPVKTAPTITVPKEMPELKLIPGIIDQLLSKLGGLCLIAGLTFIVMFVADWLEMGMANFERISIAVLALAGSFLTSTLQGLMQFCRAKRFIKKNGYEDSIRNDTPALTNAINAFGLCASMPMVRYINKLNPSSGKILADAVKKGNKKRRKEKLASLPYLIVLALAYCLIPYYRWFFMFDEQTCLIVIHIVTFLVTGFYAFRKKASWSLVLVAMVMFAATLNVFYYDDVAYQALICGGVVFVAQMIGGIFNPKT